MKIYAKPGQAGRIFGSVTAKEIAEEIKKQFGIEVDKRKVVLPMDIKAFGTYNFDVKFYGASPLDERGRLREKLTLSPGPAGASLSWGKGGAGHGF